MSAQRNSGKGNNICGTVPDGDIINQCDQIEKPLGERKNEGHMTGNQEELRRASENSSVWPLIGSREMTRVSVA